ncbi:hypothetical protein OJ998_00865 [Solirubrobacter taibaiensis]|nr:hypothetical protein [Solirubrobacter taibaiensis]
MLEIAVQRDSRGSAPGGVERNRRQRPQQLAFMRHPLGDMCRPVACRRGNATRSRQSA